VIEDDAVVEDSIIMDHTIIGKGCMLKRVIVDKFNILPEKLEIGTNAGKDLLSGKVHIDPSGIRIIAKPERKVG
jgi:glucose-1-phosphate adenylyltransferase